MLALHGIADAGSAGGRAPARPPLPLLRLHRTSLTHVLVMGGSASGRADVARAFHVDSPLRAGPLVMLDCAGEERRLCHALHAWISGPNDSSDSSLMVAERGTLYLDRVEALSPAAQRLLLAFVNAHASALRWDPVSAWSGRLIAGAARDLDACVDEGRFDASLLDALDKARVTLDGDALEGVA